MPVDVFGRQTSSSLSSIKSSLVACLTVILPQMKPEQKNCHFADDISKQMLLNENHLILIQISLNFLPRGWVDNKSALV